MNSRGGVPFLRTQLAEQLAESFDPKRAKDTGELQMDADAVIELCTQSGVELYLFSCQRFSQPPSMSRKMYKRNRIYLRSATLSDQRLFPAKSPSGGFPCVRAVCHLHQSS